MSTAIAVTGTTQRTSPARRRILDTAHRLFYAEGIRAVGIDRIIAQAGVAKATFYHHFPAKDDLVCGYLAEHSDSQRAAAITLRATGGDPMESLLTVFDVHGELACGPGFRGCPFINAAAEYPDPDHPVRLVITEHRRWFRELLRDLLVQARHPDAEQTADMLTTLRDGLAVDGYLGDPAGVRGRTRDLVTRVLGA